MRAFRNLAVLGFAALAACKPPATDRLADRQDRAATGNAPSQPLDSPDTHGAIWSQSANPGRLIYGKPGEPPLFALACNLGSVPKQLVFIRYASADKDAQAFLALIGNGHVARIPVDAVEQDERTIWQGEADPTDQRMEAFSGARTVTATIPGAGMVTLNPSPLPGRLVEECAASPALAEDEPAQPAQ